MLRILIIICIATWIIPVKLAHAEENMADQPFINYAQYHKQDNPVLETGRQETDTHAVPTSLQRAATARTSPNEPEPLYEGKRYSKEEVIQLIKDYSAQYGIDSEAPLCIAKFESGYNQFSKNKNSSASGVYQYLSGTWKGTDEGRAGLSPFDADANVRAAIKYMYSRRSTQPWEVRSKCPSIKPI